MSTVDVISVLRATRHEAQKNAAVLDHISSPQLAYPPQTGQEVQALIQPDSQRKQDKQCRELRDSRNDVNVELKADATLNREPSHKSNYGAGSHENGKVAHRSGSPTEGSAPPISKYVLASLFLAADEGNSKPDSGEHSNYIFVGNDQENHFMYGLVLPLIGRIMAVSCPGLLCLMHLPRTDAAPEWSNPSSYDGYGSNGSNGSKSAAHTTPSPQGTSRTPSPSDEGGSGPRKSVSPDAETGTEELIRRADKILAGREEAAVQHGSSAAVTEEGSPPPDSAGQDNNALRLMCNGFEVLTGKMPPPRYDMGSFTLASVGWEKAGVINPEHPFKGITMNFSNGMMTATEGLVVTFSNGSMCFLTLRDPLLILDTIRVAESTPVVVFTFSSPGRDSVGDLLSQSEVSISPEMSRVRTNAMRKNVFVVEIGHTNKSSEGGLDLGAWDKVLLTFSRGDGSVQRTAPSPPTEQADKEQDKRNIPRCPAILMNAIPRAIPLFVNTINQTFIEPPYYEVPENAYEHELMNDRFVGMNPQRIEREQSKRKGNKPPKSSDERNMELIETTQGIDRPPHPSGSQGPEMETPPLRGPLPSTATSPASDVKASPVGQISVQATPTSSTHLPPRPPSGSIHRSARPTNHEQGPPQIYSYYTYPPGHPYARQRPHNVAQQPNPSVAGTHVPVHRGPSVMNGHHSTFYQSLPGLAHGPSGHYHHPATGSYSHPTYYPLPPPSMLHHPLPHGNGTWHSPVPGISHQANPFPPPHPMDARRDMPAHFASHRAVTNSPDNPLSSQFYNSLPPIAKEPTTYPNKENTDGDIQRKAKPPGAHSLNQVTDADITRASLEQPVKGAEGQASKQIGSRTVFPSASKERTIQTSGDASRDPRLSSASQASNPSGANDKERALHALMQMRNGDRSGQERVLEKRPRSSGPGSSREAGDYNTMGSEHQVSLVKSNNPSSSIDAYNLSSHPGGRVNGMHSALKGRATSMRSRRNSETNSSTSTNSQGGALMNGVVTGNSHSAVQQGYLEAPHNAKKPRKG